MSAVGTQAREHVRPTDPPGSDADAWFSALDDRMIELGPTTCMARVQGIHYGPDGLWIQLSCEGHTEISVVVHVTTATRVEDVLVRLKTDLPVGRPLEIVDTDGRLDTSSTRRLGGRPTPRNTD